MLNWKLRIHLTSTGLLTFTWLAIACLSQNLNAQQLVFVDFDSETSTGEHFYTNSEREQILEELTTDYRPFLVSFTDTDPQTGEFSTVTLNSGPGLGIAESIDFRNLNRSDNATVNVNGAASTSAEFVLLTTTVVSHELGHLLGLRHGDSFGPIGFGIDPGTVTANSYRPSFRGPQLADETMVHIMESDDVFVEANVAQFFSERSAIRLTFNEFGTTIPEQAGSKAALATAQDIELRNLTVPNTLESGDRAGAGDFDVDAVVVTGNIAAFGEVDFYRFEAQAGDNINIEVISNVLDDRYRNPIDPQVMLLDENGNNVNYFGVSAFNDDEFESPDSILLDVPLPSTGSYFIRIDTFSPMDTGNYELFVTRFNGVVPPPLAGDFDRDGDVDIDDNDFYVGTFGLSAVAELSQLDLNSDDQITFSDFEIHITQLVQTSNGRVGTFLGDFNLDGTVNVLGDGLTLVNNLGNPATSYAQGDANLDGMVTVLGDALALIVNLNQSNSGNPLARGQTDLLAKAKAEAKLNPLPKIKRQTNLIKELPMWLGGPGPLDCRCHHCNQ